MFDNDPLIKNLSDEKKTSAQEILDMFTMADKDEDGKINYEEFLIMITPRKVVIPCIQL